MSQLPHGWNLQRLDEVSEVINGGTPKTSVKEYWDGEHFWITPAEMGKRETPYIDESQRTLSDQGLQNSSATLVPPYSVIMSTRAPIGHLVINTKPMAFNQGCRGIVPRDGLEHKYLYYFLLSSVELLNDLGTGATFKELSAGKLKSVLMPIPSVDEQQRIVTILDKAFAGITAATANAEKNLQNARELFERALEERIFPNGYDELRKCTTVEKVAEPEKGSIRTGPFGSQLLKHEFVDEGIPVLGIDNAVSNQFQWGKKRFITPEKYKELSRYTVKPGDVLITIMGTCGRCAIVPDDIPTAINTKHLCCITLDKGRCLPEFLHMYFLHSPTAKKYLASKAKGAIMAGLNMGIIKELPLYLPSLEEQQQLVEIASKLRENVERLEAIYTQKLNEFAELKQSILQKAFAGELH